MALSVVAEIVQLTDKNFYDRTKIGTEHQTQPFFVLFFSPKCPHCIPMHATWTEAEKKLRGGKVVIAQVNVTEEPALVERYRIRGWPAMLYYDTDGVVYEYTGARDVSSVMAYARGEVPRSRRKFQ